MIVRYILLSSCILLIVNTTTAAANKSKISTLNQWFIGLRNIFENCPDKLLLKRDAYKNATSGCKIVRALSDCARSKALLVIDDILEEDVIPIVSGLNLVKYQYDNHENNILHNASLPMNSSVTLTLRKLLKRVHKEDDNEVKKDYTWREKLINRLARVLKTHAIKIDVEKLGPTIPDVTTDFHGRSSDGQVEGRRRRRRKGMQMIPIIMMGVLLMGTVLIPMGFQFLAVLGGKALILAKMALMLSSIQGLKKIATNGVNYGLYHTPVPEVWHERSTGPHELPYVTSQLANPVQHHTGYHLDNYGHYTGRSAVQPT